MSYDLNVLVLHQKQATALPFTSSIDIIDEFQECLRYKEIWRFMTMTEGVWYILGKEEDGWFNTLSIVDTDFDECKEDKQIPYWVLDDDIISNLTPIIVYNEFKSDFEKILKFLIQQSPTKTIMFLARYQGGEHEVVGGVLKYLEFITLLNKNKILFNVCYIISE